VKLIGQTIKPNLPWHVLTNASVTSQNSYRNLK